MAAAGRRAGEDRESRLRTIDGLHLALLVHTEDDGSLRRVEVDPDHVTQLLDELGMWRA